MKPKLNKEDQAKQKKIREKLSSGEKLFSLAARSKGKTGSGKVSEKKSTHHALTGRVTMPLSSKPDSKTSESDRKTIAPSVAKQIIPAVMGLIVNPLNILSHAAKRYTVRKGDTLESIAKRNGTTVDKLKKLNSLSEVDAADLKAGQKIRIR